jgi:hypothetical protein
MSKIEIQGQQFEIFSTWEEERGIRRKAYTLVGPKGKVFETFRGYMRGENHLLYLLDKKTRKPLPNIKLTDARGSLEIAKTGLPSSEG